MASFDEVSQSWLMKFLEHRIADPRILHLIQKWLKAGILEDGVVTVSEKGTGQGSVISPLLANAYLHYSFDLWAERWRRRNVCPSTRTFAGKRLANRAYYVVVKREKFAH